MNYVKRLKLITKESMKSTFQVLFVVFAFTVMAYTSYFYSSAIMRNHLIREAKSTLEQTQSFIEADILEPKTNLANIAETVRHMIMFDVPYEIVCDYITTITEYMLDDDEMMSYVMGVYGVFDHFDGQFHAGFGWVPDADYVPQVRPWYIAAIEAGGAVGITEPYLDVAMGVTAIAYARQIFDDDGNPLGVVALDIMLDRITNIAIESNLTENSYGILADSNLTVLAHPDSNMVGLSVYHLNGGDIVADSILAGNEFGHYNVMSFEGERSIVFFKVLNNGWVYGIVTPHDAYFRSIIYMAWYMGIVGLALASILCIILIRMNHAQRDANSKMQLMLDAMPLCTTFWNNEYKVVDCNYEAIRLFDLVDKNEYIRRYHELSPEHQPCGTSSYDKMVELVKTAYEQGYNRFEWMHQNDHAILIPCEVTLVRMEYRGEYIVIGYCRDMREEKEMISALHEEIEHRMSSEAANLAKTSFLATMSHEIRTPMNAILGVAEIQLQDTTIPPNVQEGLIKIHDAGYTLLHIINDMLDLSKIEAGKMEVKTAIYEVPSLINDTVHLNIMRLGSKEVDFELDVNEEIPLMLLGDELRIKQVLNNLLSNAFKYTDKGSVTLTVKAEPYEDNEHVDLIFIIEDTGRGMTKEQVETMFDEYSRFATEAESVKLIEGVGLGMSIVRRLVEMMHGEVIVESEAGKGTVFKVRIKQGVDNPQPIGKEVVKQLKKFKFHGKHVKGTDLVREYMPYGSVLVVDDVDTNLYVAKGFLSPYGLNIDTAISGFEAIDKIRAGASYDIIFMDHMMPQMDGMETTKLIRLMGYKKPVVALTANALVGRAEMFLSSGFDDFISKPIDIRQLNTCLNRLIRDRQTPEAIAEAREMKKQIKQVEVFASQIPQDDPELREIFERDAQKTLKTMGFIHEGNYHEDELQSFVISVHGIKNALRSISEDELSQYAYKLEKAGRDKDIELLKAEVPAFLDALKRLIKGRPETT